MTASAHPPLHPRPPIFLALSSPHLHQHLYQHLTTPHMRYHQHPFPWHQPAARHHHPIKSQPTTLTILPLQQILKHPTTPTILPLQRILKHPAVITLHHHPQTHHRATSYVKTGRIPKPHQAHLLTTTSLIPNPSQWLPSHQLPQLHHQ